MRLHWIAVIATTVCLAWAQDSAVNPPPYRGANLSIGGVFVTPVPGAPFSAVVKIESTQTLADGTVDVRKTINDIARDSQGRIYNERRVLMPASFTGTPPLESAHIFDPQTRVSTSLNPYTHLARQQTIPERRRPELKGEDLGTEVMENVTAHGNRLTRTIPAGVSGTGKDVVIVDEYWYSDELHMNMLTKHSDPRTGVQVLTITQLKREEPNAGMFEVPSGYKVIDENPPK
jgi:hypothetical protein